MEPALFEMPPPLLSVRLPPLTVMALPPEPTRLEASTCSEFVDGLGMLTVAPAHGNDRITPFGRFVSTLTDEVQIDAVSPVNRAEPGTWPQLQFPAEFQLKPTPPVSVHTAASACGAPTTNMAARIVTTARNETPSDSLRTDLRASGTTADIHDPFLEARGLITPNSTSSRQFSNLRLFGQSEIVHSPR